VDFLTGIPYKWMNGPNGVGFLYVRENIIPQVHPDRLGWMSTDDFLSLDTMESHPLPKNARRFEYGTLGFQSIYALDTAIDCINRLGIENIEQQNMALVNKLRERLRDRRVEFFTPERNRSPILTFYIDDEKTFGQKMKKRNIYITARRWGRGHVRISPHFYNDEEDIERFIDAFDRCFSA
ncbi:MAG: aminotransferase class V-fold PLP-dependent enzyme, partial [bacterium]